MPKQTSAAEPQQAIEERDGGAVCAKCGADLDLNPLLLRAVKGARGFSYVQCPGCPSILDLNSMVEQLGFALLKSELKMEALERKLHDKIIEGGIPTCEYYPKFSAQAWVDRMRREGTYRES